MALDASPIEVYLAKGKRVEKHLLWLRFQPKAGGDAARKTKQS
jgi:hypothetical protein